MPTLFEAFGERKTATEWSRDPRCVVEKECLKTRLYRLGMDVRQALRTPARKPRLLEAFGEKKTLGAWSRDPRCDVTEAALYYRLCRGIPLEEAILLPSQELPPKFDVRKRKRKKGCKKQKA